MSDARSPFDGGPRGPADAADRAADPGGPRAPQSRRRRALRPGHTLTRRGLAFLVVGVSVGVLSVALRERDLLFVGVLAATLPVLAWISTGLRRVTLAVDYRSEPQRLQAGETGAVRLRLTNTGTRTTRPLDLTQPGVRNLLRGARRAVPPVPPGARTALTLPLHARRRGGYTIRGPLLRLTDPIGMSEVRRVLPAATDVLVLPTVVPLVGLPRGLSGRGTASGTSHGQPGGGDPDAGVRAYRIGDDIRSIHWRASARLEEELVVRVSGPTTLGSAVLVLDHRAVAHTGTDGVDGLEVAVTLGASIGHHLLEQDVELTVTDHAGHEIVAGHDVADDLLAALAVAGEPATGDGAPRAAWHPVVPGGPDAVVAVVGPLPADEATVLATQRRGTAIAFVLADGAEGADGAECTRVLRTAGWRVIEVDVADAGTPDGGAHLAQAWRAACRGAGARDARDGRDARDARDARDDRESGGRSVDAPAASPLDGLIREVPR